MDIQQDAATMPSELHGCHLSTFEQITKGEGTDTPHQQ